MNYEKKYKDALERMKSWANGEHPECFSEAQKTAEFIFPELRVSEDEKIKREIVAYINELADLKNEKIPTKWLTWLEKQGENKHINEVKSKFKVGDWITNGYDIWKIVEVNLLDYILQSQDGNIVEDTISYVDEQFHSFTIEDANDGDVLVNQNGEMPFIFKECKNNHIYCYCGYTNRKDIFFDRFVDSEGEELHWLNLYHEQAYPATKEQRDLLFQKMRESGYEWDAEKKEVKKIELKKGNVNKVIEWINSDKVIKWLKDTIRKTTKNYGVYKETHLILPYNSIEDLINDFKEDFGL